MLIRHESTFFKVCYQRNRALAKPAIKERVGLETNEKIIKKNDSIASQPFKKPILVLSCALSLICALGIYYHILYDFFILGTLFHSAYCIGQLFSMSEKNAATTILQIAVGLGIIGVIIYYVLLAGIGNRVIYILLLVFPVILQIKKLPNTIACCMKVVRRLSVADWVYVLVLLALFLFYAAYAVAPMCDADTLVKHLPTTVSAANSGAWYTNVVESVIYGESAVLQYTYSTLLYVLGAYKALSLLNTVCFFLIFATLLCFCHHIYAKINRYIFAAIFFSVPIFFEAATRFYLDILPEFFLFSAMVSYCDLKPKQVWDNLLYVGFLFGCAIFAKLTVSYGVLSLGLIALGLYGYYIYQKKVGVKAFLIRTMKSAAAFLFPFVPPLLVMWYRVGNPFYPFYNAVFNSPYFHPSNFIDPFQSHPLGFNLQSLINMIFHTDLNVEMYPMGLGVFLLLIFLIPAACLIHRKPKIIVWGIAPFAIYWAATLFTYNLRYYICVFMLVAAMITIGVSLCLEKVARLSLKTSLAGLLILCLSLPGICHINQYYKPEEKLIPNSAITNIANQSVVSKIPSGSRVFALNGDPYKGVFDGYWSAFSWHSYYWINKVENGEMTLDDYAANFDYLLYRKDLPILYEHYKNMQGMPTIIETQRLSNAALIQIAENETHILYRIMADSAESTKQDFIEKEAERLKLRELL